MDEQREMLPTDGRGVTRRPEGRDRGRRRGGGEEK